MPTIRDLFVEIGLKVDDAPLKRFDKGIERLDSKLRILRRSLLLVSAAGIAGFGFLIKKGGTLEQIEIGFEVMLGSAEKAQATLAELFEFAKTTPFEIEGILKVSSGLIGMGFEAKDLIGVLNDLGNDAAGLPNASLERLALNLGQVRSQGKLTRRDLKDFAVAGLPLVDILAKKLGKATTEIDSMITANKISFKLVREVFADLSKEGGRFFNLMIRQSNTTFGIFSNIKDVITLLAQDISKDLLPIVRRLENQFLDFLETNKKIIKLRIQKLIKEIIDGLKMLIKILSDVGASIWAVVQALGGLENTIQLVAIAMAILFGISTLTAIGDVVIAIGTLTKALFLMGSSGAIATLKVTALPLAVGIAVIALILLLDDVASFFTGKKSLTGLLIKAFATDYPNAFRKTEEGLKRIKESLQSLQSIASDIINFRFKLGFEKLEVGALTGFDFIKEKAIGVLRSISEKGKDIRRRLDADEITSFSDIFGGGSTPAQAPATSTVNNVGPSILSLSVPLTIQTIGEEGNVTSIEQRIGNFFSQEFEGILQSAHKATQPQVSR